MGRGRVVALVILAAVAAPVGPWPGRPGVAALAEEADPSAKEAFEAARALGTVDAWQAFLARYRTGFYADLARAHLKKVQGDAPMPSGRATAPPPATGPTGAAEGTRIPLGPHADLRGLRLLPDDSPWHQDVSRAPVDRRSGRILARIGDKPLHPDFGPVWDGVPLGIPYVVVPGTQQKVPVTFAVAEESDPGPYPIPRDAPIEGGPKGDGDRHVLVLDRDNWVLYELFNAFPQPGGAWKADGGAIWDLKTNQVRPDRWTSADAAGLPILPGLVRYDEVVGAKAIAHALRFTLAKTRRAYVPPASHWASESFEDDLPPMGMRVRLKADYDIAGFAPEAQAILQGLKTYGMILADNGSDNFISGAHDPRWDPDVLRQLGRVTTRDLEVVEMKGLVADQRR